MSYLTRWFLTPRTGTFNFQRFPLTGSATRRSPRTRSTCGAALVVLSETNPTTNAILDDIEESIRKRPHNLLYRRILDQASDQVGGIYLPAGKVALKYASDRIDRVLWKIARGIYALKARRIVAQTTKPTVSLLQREQYVEFTAQVKDIVWNHDPVLPGIFDMVFVRDERRIAMLFEIWHSLYGYVSFTTDGEIELALDSSGN